MRIRQPESEELAALGALCFRSKAVWGRAVMAACREKLTLRPDDFQTGPMTVAEGGDIGVAQSGWIADRLPPKLACVL